MSTLRIRPDKGTVPELNIPKYKLEVLEKIVSSDRIMEQTKNQIIRKLTDGSSCCICRGIPSHEIRYTGDGATVIERYCWCIERVYSREQVL
jgi:hypothetical protein